MSVYVAIYAGKQVAKGTEKEVTEQARRIIREKVDTGQLTLKEFCEAKVAIHRYDHCYNLIFNVYEGDDRPISEDDI